MKATKEQRDKLYHAIYNTIVETRKELDLPPPKDQVLAQTINKIWDKQKKILGDKK
jgi:hypothetical protein